MRSVRLVLGTSLAAATMLLAPATTAAAHVHAITPLGCTPAPSNAGANQTNDTPAAAPNGGPIAGVIPVVNSNHLLPFTGGFDAAVCSR